MANCAVWDLTLFREHEGTEISAEDLIKVFKEHCKKWAFQLEKGEKTGKLHYQCRVSFKTKHRKSNVLKILPWSWVHVSPTSEENRTNNFYVTKEETRFEGPWTDEMLANYIPKRYRNIDLRPWQRQVMQTQDDDRHVNLIYDSVGGKGKSYLASAIHHLGKGFRVPPINDSKDLMAMMCDKCSSKDIHEVGHVFIDLPRSMPKNKLQGIYGAIEQIKEGYLYDTRYRFREYWIEPPTVWVFTNEMPDLKYLSRDRWRVWRIVHEELTDVDELKRVKI